MLVKVYCSKGNEKNKVAVNDAAICLLLEKEVNVAEVSKW